MKEWLKVANINDFNGVSKQIHLNGYRIALFKTEDNIYAIDDTCSHAEGSLSEGTIEDYEVECPSHGARFDIRTGKNLSFPAVTPVKSYPVKIENNDIYIQIES